jgi:hypothetical protein
MTTAPTYDRAAGQVVDMVVSGLPFAQVEEAIDSTSVRQEEKATLWLLAWSFRSPAGPGARHPADVGPIDRAKLRDGSEIRIRPVDGQEDELLAFMQALSPLSRRLRFGSLTPNLRQAARRAASADGTDHLGAVALDACDRIIAHASCVRTQGARAEVAVAVAEDRRHLGLATILLTFLAREAEQQGTRHLTAEVEPHNFSMLSIFGQRFNASKRRAQGAILLEFPTSSWRLVADRFQST